MQITLELYLGMLPYRRTRAVGPEIVLKINGTTGVTLEIAPDRCNKVLIFL